MKTWTTQKEPDSEQLKAVQSNQNQLAHKILAFLMTTHYSVTDGFLSSYQGRIISVPSRLNNGNIIHSTIFFWLINIYGIVMYDYLIL